MRQILNISIAILSLCLAPMAQADVKTEDILLVLGQAVPPPPGIIEFSNDVAVKQVLQRLVRKPDGSSDDAFARRLGFDFFPPDQTDAAVKQASTLFPIAVFLIGLQQLQRYQPGQDPLRLLAADANWLRDLPPPLPSTLVPAQFLFAIAVNDTNGQKVVQSSVRLQVNFSPTTPTPPKLSFKIERFGSGYLIRQVDKWRKNPNTTGPIVPEYFLLWIPALDRYYLGILRNKDLLIKAITDDRQVGLKEGEEDIAKEVFLRLKVEALTINADNPNAPPR